jgi:hypothetical protein
MLETQIQQISGTFSCQSNRIPSRDPIKESAKSITTIFEGQSPESSKEYLETGERIPQVNGQEIILSMPEVSNDVILNRLQNQLGGPKVPSIQCIIGTLKVHYVLCDWGASVNIMPKMVYDCMDEDSLVPVFWCVYLVDSTRVQPYGFAKDVFIEVWGSSTLMNFIVVDMDPR